MAQDDIQGQVVDAQGNPVSGAIVELTKSYQSSPEARGNVFRTTTDSNGNYIFTGHPDGDGTTQEWHVSCYNHDGTAYVNSFNNPGVTADLPSNAIPIPDSGVLRYSFEDNSATDVWGGFDGTVNGPTYQPSGGPDGLGAFDFDGSNDIIEVPSGATDVVESSGSVSVYVEVNLDSVGEDYFLFGSNGSGRLILYMDAGGDNTYRGGSDSLTNAFEGGAVSGSYQDVVLTVGGGTAEVYTDGSLTDSTTGSLESNIDGLDIGRDTSNGRNLDGQISDFRIYDKVLSSSEVSNLSNTGSISG